MIKFLRSKGSTYFVKVLLGLIILSFIPWGITNLVPSRNQGSLVAKIGKIEITQHTLLKAIENTLSQSKLNITMAEALSLGIAKTILENQIANAALGLEIQDLKLTVASETLERSIRSEPFFHNKKGKFDPRLLKEFLQSRGMSEDKLKEMVASPLLEMQLVVPLGTGIVMPRTLLNHIVKKQLEKRSFTMIRIPFESMKNIPAPKEEDLKAYYQAHQNDFSVPETRTFSVLILEDSALQKRMKIEESQIKDFYQKNLKEYNVPERRHLKLISREDKETALALKKEAGPTQFKGWVDLGQISQEEAAAKLEPAVQKAAFSLNKGTISEPIKVGDSYYMVAVEDISPKHTLSLAQARATIAAKIIEEKGEKYLVEALRAIDDQLAGGNSLKEIAKDYQLGVIGVTNVSLNDTSLRPTSLPQGITEEMVKTAFETGVNSESPRIEMEGARSYIVHVSQIKPSFVKPFEEVKSLIVKTLTQAAQKEAALKKAQNLQQAINHKKTVDLKAYEIKTIPLSDRFELMLNHAPDLKEMSTQEPKGMVKVLMDGFGVPKGHAVIGEEGAAAVVLKVADVAPVDLKKDPKFYKKIEESIKVSLINSVSHQFTNALKDKFKTTIYQEKLDHLGTSL